MRRILATDLGIWPVLSDMSRISDSMLNSVEFRANLANYILLYDQIIIPTGNLQILPVLRLVFGEGIFDELIRANILVLARYNQWFSYAGNGAGLQFVTVSGNPDLPKSPNLFHSYFCELDEAIDTVLVTTNPVSSYERKTVLKNLLLDKVVSVGEQIDPDAFKDETYKDILGSPYLRHFFSISGESKSLNTLKGIRDDQIRFYSPHSSPSKSESPEIWSVLSVAFENFILGLSTDLVIDEISGSPKTLAVVNAKAQRVGLEAVGRNAFSKIQEINRIPDLGIAFANKKISAEQLFDLRNSKSSQIFRDWFNSQKTQESADDIVARFVDEVSKTSLIDKLPVKTLRFAATNIAGVMEPVTGVIASFIDSFVLNRWGAKSPKLFINQARTLTTNTMKNTTKLDKPQLSGRDRNKPCSCNSGLKYKNCCGK